MLSGGDLMEGLGLAASAFGQPLRAHRERARQEPVEAALARYEITANEEGRARARSQEGRETGKYGMAAEAHGAGMSMLPLEIQAKRLANRSQRLVNRGRTIENESLRDRLMAELDQIRASIESSGVQDSYTRAQTNRTNTLLPHEVESEKALGFQREAAGIDDIMGGDSSGGGISPNRPVIDWKSSIDSARRELIGGNLISPDDPTYNDVLLGRAVEIMSENLRFLDEDGRAAYGPELQRIEQITYDAETMDDASFDAKYADDEIYRALLALQEFRRKSAAGSGIIRTR